MGEQALSVLARRPEGQVDIAIDDWQLTLVVDAEGLARCAHCRSPNGGQAGLEAWPRYGSNPVDLLSIWERRQLEQLLQRP